VPGDGSVFAITHGSSQFVVSISSACSGANGLVGFILIGIAFILLVHGRLLPKMAWLVGGMALTWMLNLVRIMLILAAGQKFGEAFAIGGLHPFIGLVTFNLGVIAMRLSLGLFGLRIGLPAPAATTPATAEGDARPAPNRQPAVQRARTAFALVLAAALLAAPADFAMQRFEVLAHDLGPPRLGQLTSKNAPVGGWSSGKLDQYPWISRYFGAGASWDRYGYFPTSAAGGGGSLIMDVISTWDLNTFSTYGLQACYRFHNYRILDERRVDLGHGVTGHALEYWIPKDHTTWTAVFWEWPVNDGHRQKYERVVINRVDAGGVPAVVSVTEPDLLTRIGLVINTAIGGPQEHKRDANATKRLDFLVGFGRQVVSSAASHASEAAAPTR
jgi:exosortase/archaeosortase family protein